ncbi:MAG TPA: molybdopterin cofactor-binding domain-containing protein [Gaiellaceae bacterium]|jgi:CO/xanthine dehydrogenase Mo-binding subunit/aerobic-type carbon monoxide dehydrogenase small subunit (CoxS/CutS family)
MLIRPQVNGVVREVEVSPTTTLLSLLRDDLGLTGTKNACEEGECGSCTVWLDGDPVCSCLVPGVQADGCEVRTIEAVGSPEELSAVQEAFVAAGAVQCGFCTPGLVVAATDLLERNPSPTEEEIREALAGNFCRCTGYCKIVDAVRAAGGQTPGTPAVERGVVGQSARRVDGNAKVRGAFAYGGDLRADGMLFGATLRSPHASARILAVAVERAAAAPGVHAVLTAGDVPGSPTFGLERADQPVLALEVVRYAGEPIALVAAETLEQARAAAELIDVEYEPLPAVTDIEDALAPNAPQVHDEGNLLRRVRIESGEPDASEADVWVEGLYETPVQDQAPLGLEAALAAPTPDGGVELHTISQFLHSDRRQVAASLALPEERVRVAVAGVGGAFGSREDVHAQIHACLLALHTGRPVRIAYGREESFHGHVHRHPSRTWIRYGATRDGRLVSAHVHLVLDGGAYTSSSPAVLANASTFAAGPYEVPNVRIEGTAVFTNNPPCGAMRGFGAPQVCFAHESALDALAAELGLDPVELRLRNAVRTGSVLPTGQLLTGSAPVRELIERCRALPLPDEPPAPGWTRAVGLAVGFKNVAFSEGYDDSAEATVTVLAGAGGPRAEVRTAAVDAGHGVHTVLAQIARTELGLDDVAVLPADTATIGSAGSSSASRQTMMAGGAVHGACREVRAELDRGAQLPLTRTLTYRHRPTTGFDEHGHGDVHVAFGFVAERAVVDFDPELGRVRVVQLGVVADPGRVINPQGAEGQLEGGAAIGLGLALMEEVRLDGGRIENPSLAGYLIPTTLDVPPVLTAFVEEPEPGSPYGVKGIGEHATIAAAPAIVSALRAATGRPLERLPVTPDDLLGLHEPALPERELTEAR